MEHKKRGLALLLALTLPLLCGCEGMVSERPMEDLSDWTIETGADVPTQDAFAAETQMRETNVQLMSFECTGGTVSLDGQRATVVLDAAIHSDEGGDAQIVRESVPLIRQSDNWCVALATLESLMIRD